MVGETRENKSTGCGEVFGDRVHAEDGVACDDIFGMIYGCFIVS